MQNAWDAQPSRREMLHSGARYLALGGLSALSVFLLAKGTDSSADDACRRPMPCRKCPVLSRCSLPQAASAKRRGRR